VKMRGLGSIAGHFRQDGTAKVAYASQAEALAVSPDRAAIGAYECSLCGRWHLGHRRGKARRRKRRKLRGERE
jgi:hypothetical protein